MQFLERDRIENRHVLERRIPEEDPGLEPEFVGEVAAQVLEHRQQLGVSTAPAAAHRRTDGRRLLVVLVIASAALEDPVFHEPDLIGMAVEFLAFLGHVKQAVRLDFLFEQVHHEPLVDDRGPETVGMVAAGAEDRQLVVVVGLDHRVRVAREDVGEVVDLEMLRERQDQADHQHHLLPPVECLPRVEAVVTGTAVVGGIVLSEIVQQQLAAALVGFGVGDGLHEELPPDLLLGDGLALHELLQLLDVLVAVVGDAVGRLVVTAGAAGLLVIAFDALGNVVMDDEADIRFVDAHAKGDGGYDHVDILHQEAVLVLGPHLRIQARMVRKRFYSIDIQ